MPHDDQGTLSIRTGDRMMSSIRVSIVIPTFKRSAMLKAALDSVAHQTYGSHETIVVNDCPDDSLAVAAACDGAGLMNLRLIHHPSPLGGNAARNTGIRASTGDIVAFLDDDDVWLPGKLKSHVEAHRARPNAALVYSGVVKAWQGVPLPKRVFPAAPLPPDVKAAMTKRGFCPPTTSAVSVRRAALDAVGHFDETLVSFQDWDMWLRLAEAFEFAVVKEPQVIFRQHLLERTSQGVGKRLKGLEQVSNKWSSTYDLDHFVHHHTYEAYRQEAVNSALRGKLRRAFESLKTLRRQRTGQSGARDLRTTLMILLLAPLGAFFKRARLLRLKSERE